MSGDRHLLVVEALEVQVPLRAEVRADWADVLRRAEIVGLAGTPPPALPRPSEGTARRPVRSRRALVLALAALLAAAAVSSAFGWPARVLDAIVGEPPPRVRDAFALQNEARERVLPVFREHASMEPILERLHGVVGIETSLGSVILWVAPTQGGGACWLVEVESDPHPPSIEGCAPRPLRRGIVIQAGFGGTRVGEEWLELVKGRVRADVASVEVRYEEGERETVEVFEGFFLHEPRARPALVIARDENGVALGRQRFQAPVLPIPPIATTGPERVLIRETTSSGHTLTMTLARAGNGDLCQSVYYRGGVSRGCGPDQRERIAPDELMITPGLQNEAQDGKPLVTLNGVVGSAIARLQLQYEDKTVVPVPVSEGFVLFEIPPEHHRDTRFVLVGRNEEGDILARRVVK